jgi:hypothetical protein
MIDEKGQGCPRRAVLLDYWTKKCLLELLEKQRSVEKHLRSGDSPTRPCAILAVSAVSPSSLSSIHAPAALPITKSPITKSPITNH